MSTKRKVETYIQKKARLELALAKAVKARGNVAWGSGKLDAARRREDAAASNLRQHVEGDAGRRRRESQTSYDQARRAFVNKAPGTKDKPSLLKGPTLLNYGGGVTHGTYGAGGYSIGRFLGYWMLGKTPPQAGVPNSGSFYYEPFWWRSVKCDADSPEAVLALEQFRKKLKAGTALVCVDGGELLPPALTRADLEAEVEQLRKKNAELKKESDLRGPFERQIASIQGEREALRQERENIAAERLKVDQIRATIEIDKTVWDQRILNRVGARHAALSSRRTAHTIYLQTKVDAEDWHGVSDAACDLRDIDAEMEGLRRILVAEPAPAEVSNVRTVRGLQP